MNLQEHGKIWESSNKLKRQNTTKINGLTASHSFVKKNVNSRKMSTALPKTILMNCTTLNFDLLAPDQLIIICVMIGTPKLFTKFNIKLQQSRTGAKDHQQKQGTQQIWINVSNVMMLTPTPPHDLFLVHPHSHFQTPGHFLTWSL